MFKLKCAWDSFYFIKILYWQGLVKSFLAMCSVYVLYKFWTRKSLTKKLIIKYLKNAVITNHNPQKNKIKIISLKNLNLNFAII